MPVMACLQNIVDGHGDGSPFAAAAAKACHGPLVVGALTRRCRDHMCYRLAMPGNRHGLAALDRAEEFGQTCLGFGCLYDAHREIQPVIITGHILSCVAGDWQSVRGLAPLGV